MDAAGLKEVLTSIESGEIEVYARDTVQPSVFSHQLLNTMPYAFLDERGLWRSAGPGPSHCDAPCLTTPGTWADWTPKLYMKNRTAPGQPFATPMSCTTP